MILRWLVGNLVRQAAEKKIQDVVTQATQAVERLAIPNPATRTSGGEPAVPCEIAIVFATGVEAGGTVDLLADATTTYCARFVERTGRFGERHVAVIEAGEGATAATQAVEDLIALQHPKWVVSAGFAGALDERLRPGHVLMADSVGDATGKRMAVGMRIDPAVVAATPGLHVGRLLSVDHLVYRPEERRELARQHEAVACDLETAAIAELCHREKIRFLSVRVITDAVADELPPETSALLEQKTFAAKLGAATATLFARPSSVKDLWKLREHALKASDRLAKFLAGVVPQLNG